jgi:hypothetical protein
MLLALNQITRNKRKGSGRGKMTPCVCVLPELAALIEALQINVFGQYRQVGPASLFTDLNEMHLLH